MTDAETQRRSWGGNKPSPRDVIAGIVVATVVIPQSMAYAELAGLPGFHGLYAAALPLMAAAFFVSCPYLQTGPVALTALLTYGALVPLAEPGSAQFIGAAALLALVVGITRVAIGLGQAGWVSYLMSQPVVRGFTSGAALLIIASQVPGVLGITSTAGGPVQGVIASFGASPDWNLISVALALLTIVVILIARRLSPLAPGVLIAVVAGVLFSAWSGYSGPVVGDVPGSLPPITLDLPWRMFPQLIVPGVVIALVGFAEAAAIARTFAGRERKRWDPDREFLSQGAANLVSAVSLGFPVGGSFSRSSLNNLSGARTRWSGAMTGAVVLVFLPFAGLLSPLPKAVLAAIVISAVAGLVRLRELLGLWSMSHAQAAVAWITFALCLVLSPRIDQALLLGILLSLATRMWRERRARFKSHVEGTTLHIEAGGVLWFASAPRLQDEILGLMADLGPVNRLVIHLGGLGRIDLSGALVLKEIVEEVEASGIQTSLENVPAHARKIIDNVFDPRVRAGSFGP